jgi:hypothetical protein
VSQQINLFNPVFLKQNKFFSALAMAQGLGLLCIGLIALIAFSSYQMTRVRQDAAVAAAQLTAAQIQLTQMVDKIKPVEKDKALEEAIQKSESRLGSSQRVLDFVAKGDFGRSQGYSEYFRAFIRRMVAGVWLTGFSIDDGGNAIEIDGRALQPGLVPVYISGLKNESVFKGKSFGSMQLRTPAANLTEPREKAGSPSAKPAAGLEYVEFSLKTSEAGSGQMESKEATK